MKHNRTCNSIYHFRHVSLRIFSYEMSYLSAFANARYHFRERHVRSLPSYSRIEKLQSDRATGGERLADKDGIAGNTKVQVDEVSLSR